MEAKMPQTIRTRFAPSPTGFLHIGSVRTALYNYLFAKKNNGIFVLRIEDTDQERSTKEYEADILAGMKWLGLDWDEGPEKGGEYGPYLQSERKGIYRRYLEKLIDEGYAYYCFCDKKDLEAKKNYQISQGMVAKYDGKCAGLSREQAAEKISQGISYVIRFRVPEEKISFEDLIRGKVEFDCSLFGDMVIATGLDSPLYNFAVVIDDYEMKITHIIRGEDHIPNTPKQILIQRALGFPRTEFAHMPMILGPDKSKLSKRHNAEPVNYYYKNGYLPEAINNFIVFLGWNPGNEREIFSKEELIKEFSLERCRKSGAIFNIQKLDWFNGVYIRNMDPDELAKASLPYLIAANLINKDGDNYLNRNKEKIDFAYIKKAVLLYRERLVKLSELPELVDFLFINDIAYPTETLLWKNMSLKDADDALREGGRLIEEIPDDTFSFSKIESKFSEYLADPNASVANRGYLLWPLRVSLTGKKASCGPFEAADALGKKQALIRIKQAREKIAKEI